VGRAGYALTDRVHNYWHKGSSFSFGTARSVAVESFQPLVQFLWWEATDRRAARVATAAGVVPTMTAGQYRPLFWDWI
jgi:hypothetical protein